MVTAQGKGLPVTGEVVWSASHRSAGPGGVRGSTDCQRTLCASHQIDFSLHDEACT